MASGQVWGGKWVVPAVSGVVAAVLAEAGTVSPEAAAAVTAVTHCAAVSEVAEESSKEVGGG